MRGGGVKGSARCSNQGVPPFEELFQIIPPLNFRAKSGPQTGSQRPPPKRNINPDPWKHILAVDAPPTRQKDEQWERTQKDRTGERENEPTKMVKSKNWRRGGGAFKRGGARLTGGTAQSLL